MRPAEVLDHQAALIDALGNPQYRGYLSGFLKSIMRGTRKDLTEDDWQETTSTFTLSMKNSLTAASAYHVQAEMMPVLRAAASELDGLDYLVHDRLPSEHGFLIFDQPWMTMDVTGSKLSVNALQWGHASFDGEPGSTPGIWIFYYTDINDPYDEVTKKIFEGLTRDQMWDIGRYHMAHCQFLAYEERVGPAELLTPEDYQTLFGYRQDQVVEKTPNDARLIVALFRLLGQVLVEVKDAPIERAASRRAKRMNIPARVQTVKLRRKEVRYLNEGDHEHGTVEWQHSWWVRGHWAWRACGPDHPLAEPYEKGHRARLYIAPYPKGPEDAPVLITSKVFDLAQ